MPPSPFGSGQLFGLGRAAKAAASIRAEAGQAIRRHFRVLGTVRATRCQPQAASGRNRKMAASPRDWIPRSAITAPQSPRRLRGAARVALFRLGSLTDQVARLSHTAQAPAIRKKP